MQLLARQQGVDAALTSDVRQQQRIDGRSRLQGAAVDAAYLRTVKHINKQDVTEEQREASSISDDALRQLITKSRGMDGN